MSHRAVNGLIITLAVLVGAVVLAAVVFEPELPGEGDVARSESSESTTPTASATANQADDGATARLEDESTPAQATVELITVSGRVSDAGTDEPLADVEVSAGVDGDGDPAASTTAADGTFQFEDVPADTTLTFSRDGYRTVEHPVEDPAEIEIALESSVLAGTVLDGNGEPVYDATVASGEALASTDRDGAFQIDDAPDEGEVIVKAPGYRARSIPVQELEDKVTLERQSIKGLYATAGAVGDNERFTALMDTIERTELNAMVVDIKDSAGLVFHDTGVEMAHEIDAVAPAYDAEHVLQELESRDIYAIARIVIFEDPILAEARPDLAIQDSEEGGVWETFTGIPWTNPYQEGVWEYNIELMREAVELGFDEVQLDYMRFPTDGPLNRADYGQESTAETRDQAIADFLTRAHEELAPTTAYLAGDIFGMTLWQPDEGEIGQDLTTVTRHLDYVHPMIYPSHFYEGAMGFDVPNDHPYEVILQSLEHGMGMLESHQKPKIRPWLQDFSYGVGIEYGPNEVQEQIRATEDFDASGWMLWNAAADYHEDALGPAE